MLFPAWRSRHSSGSAPGTQPLIGDDALLGDCAGSALVSRAEHWNLFRDVMLPGAMAALALPLGVLTHGDLWYAARLVGGVFQREAPNGTLAVLLGLGVHVATAGGLATLFAMLIPREGTGTAALMLGVLMGLALQVAMPALVIPWASPPLDREMSHGTLLLLHLAFGASLGAVVPARRLV